MKLKACKDPSLADEPIHLEISGLIPEQKITLHSSVVSSNSAILECLAHYVADKSGYISLEKHESLGGDYKGIEPMGPFSFMRPSPLNKRKYERFLIKDPTKPFKVEFRLFNGFILSLEDESAKNRFHAEPDLIVSRMYMAPGVKEIPVWDGNVRATLYLPVGEGPFPGVISMSGGYPGAMKYKAAILASHGFAALALKYFGEDDLPDSFYEMDLEYIEESTKFLINHPSVTAEQGIGIIANCYGGTLALAAASVFPKGLIRCVATTNGWSFPTSMIAYKGKEIASITSRLPITSLSEDGIRTITLQYDLESTFEIMKSSSVPCFDRHNVSYLFVVGEDDSYVQSSELVLATKCLLEDANHPDCEILCYKGAGHLVEHSFYPLASIAWTFLKEPHFNGGKQPFHSIAENDSWPKILEFVHKRLSISTSKL